MELVILLLILALGVAAVLGFVAPVPRVIGGLVAVVALVLVIIGLVD